MTVLKRIVVFIIVFGGYILQAQEYKTAMNDPQVNFYEVCSLANHYFSSIDKELKGSGWKNFERWKFKNEPKYYPDGNRSGISPYYSANAFTRFLTNNPTNKNIHQNGWKELGPLIIDSITGHYAPGFGRLEDLYVDPTNANTIYVGSRSGGFWRTNNGGLDWECTTDFLIATGVNAIAVDPMNSAHILINIRNANNGTSHGIYESFDGGTTWNVSNFNPTTLLIGGLGSNFKIYAIQFHPTIANLVFIGTSNGIYRSDNGLNSWTLALPTNDVFQIAFHPTNNQIVYVTNTSFSSTRNYVYRSVDQGVSFNQSSLIVGNDGATPRISVSPDCPSCVFFASDNGVWESQDEGVNFTFIINPDEACRGFTVSDVNANFQVYGYVDIESSQNRGVTYAQTSFWSLGNTNHGAGNFSQRFINSIKYVHADLRVAKCVNGVFYVGTDGMIAKSEDNGITWTSMSQGLGVRENYKLGASQSNHFVTISGSQDNGTSIKKKETWVEFYGADGMEGLIHPLNYNYMIGSFQYGGRRRTLDGGLTQSSGTPPGQSGSGSGYWEAPIAYDPNHQMSLYNFSDSIYVSEDFGDNWTYRGVPNGFTGSINQAAIAENNSTIIAISKGSNIEKSIDGGQTFTSIKANLPNYFIEDIAFHPKNDEIIIVCYARYQDDNKKVYITYDGGSNWNNITYNLGSMPTHTVVIDHSDSSYIYLGAEIGVYVKSLNGTNWELYNPALPNTTIEELEIVYGSNTLKAATWGRGLWEYCLKNRCDYPAITLTTITDLPTLNSPKFGINQYVSSQISYDGVLSQAYVLWSVDTPIFDQVIPMSNIQDSTWRTDSPIPNFPVAKDVYFKVFAIGEQNDTSETYKFMYTVQPFEYCDASGDMIYQGSITQVELNTINRISGKTQAYTDYRSTDSTIVEAGLGYPLNVKLNTDNGNYTYFARAWIDWNRDADFDDPNEQYELGSVTNNSNGLTSFSPLNIIVPFNAQIGTTTMRVACLYNQEPSACQNGVDGEVEDYKIVVIEGPEFDYTIAQQNLCIGDSFNIEYNGINVDSLRWNIFNSDTLLSSTQNSFSDILEYPGPYELQLLTYLNGQLYTQDSLQAIYVFPNQQVNSFTYTCDLTNVYSITDTFQNQMGCDSFYTEAVVFNNDLNTNLIYNNNVLSVLQQDANYQWYDCANGFNLIPNETDSFYNPTENGQYAVVVSLEDCIDTSFCYLVNNLFVRELSQNLYGVEILPNPTDGIVVVKIKEKYEALILQIYDINGRLVDQTNSRSSSLTKFDISNEAAGTYFLLLTIDGSQNVFELIKK